MDEMLDSRIPYIPKMGVVDFNKVGGALSLCNMASDDEPVVARQKVAKMESASQLAYNHPGQVNPNITHGGALDDTKAVRSIMQLTNSIAGISTDENDSATIKQVVETAMKLVELMTVDLPLWVPGGNQEVINKLKGIGDKLAPHITKYANIVRSME